MDKYEQVHRWSEILFLPAYFNDVELVPILNYLI